MRRESSPVTKIQILGFVAIYATIFSVLIYKAFTLPITHDEAWTLLDYTKFSTWEIMMYPDAWPNNHILNTLLAKYSCAIFGMHDWSARIPNLLFFIVYGWGVFRFLRITLRDKMYFFLPASLIFILSPYFLDFFSLCRGYGISSALTMLSLSFFVSAFTYRKKKHIWWAITLAILASYANFTVLVFWAAALMVAALYFLVFKKTWKECFKYWGILAGTSLLYLALIAMPIYKMKTTNQFEFWTSNGFYQDTVLSVVHSSLSDSGVFTRADWIAKSVVFTVLALWLVVILALVQSRFKAEAFRKPIVIVGVVLLFAVGVNLLQTSLLGDPNLNGRTALFLLPIFSAFAVTGLLLVPKGRFRSVGPVIAGLIVFVAIQHLTTTVRLNSFREWRFDAHTFEVLEKIKPKRGGEVTLETHWLFNNSFRFYVINEELPWLKVVEYNAKINVESVADYYYLPAEETLLLEGRFQKVTEYQGGAVLMKRID